MASINMMCLVLALYVTGALLSGDQVLAKCEVDEPSLLENLIEPCRSSLITTHRFHSHHYHNRRNFHRHHGHIHHRSAGRPSQECCSALGRSDITCICQHYPKVMERFVSMSKFTALLGSCGHEFAQGVTCGGSGDQSREDVDNGGSGDQSREDVDNGSEINE